MCPMVFVLTTGKFLADKSCRYFENHLFYAGKSEKVYMKVHQELLGLLNDRGLQIVYKEIIQDFELGSMNAI